MCEGSRRPIFHGSFGGGISFRRIPDAAGRENERANCLDLPHTAGWQAAPTAEEFPKMEIPPPNGGGISVEKHSLA